ncbi:MAG: (d)CMP kinase [Spirochaetales bacterium]|nr:(d)CMP kinase [Spirochaetales bacterium]
MIIAIDGPAGSGKSSVARRVAQRAGFEYINSGNFYRAVTLAVLSSSTDPKDSSAVISTAKTVDLAVIDGKLCLNGTAVDDLLHTDRVDAWVAAHSAIPAVRDVVNRYLKNLAAGRNVVVEGRDITTVVFPEADLRVFIDASVEVRAQRRYDQGISSLSLEEIQERIKERDEIDRTKPVGSLKLSEGVMYLDTSLLTIDEVCDKVMNKIREIEPCA